MITAREARDNVDNYNIDQDIIFLSDVMELIEEKSKLGISDLKYQVRDEDMVRMVHLLQSAGYGVSTSFSPKKIGTEKFWTLYISW